MVDEPDRARMERLLEIEFEQLQKINDKFDGSRFMVKNWAVTTGGAVLALSVTARRPELALIGCAVVLVFAYVETLYMFFQDHVVARCNHVEHLLNAAAGLGEPTLGTPYRFGVSQAFEGSLTARGVAGALRGRPHIYVLYLGLLFALGLAAAALSFL